VKLRADADSVVRLVADVDSIVRLDVLQVAAIKMDGLCVWRRIVCWNCTDVSEDSAAFFSGIDK